MGKGRLEAFSDFAYLGIYWNNNHHLLHATSRVTGGMLWANLHLLFWLSLVPFTTAWMGEDHFESVPVALYAPWLSLALYVIVAIIWLVPDQRIERALARRYAAGSSSGYA